MDNQMTAFTSSSAKTAIQRGKITWPAEPSMPQNFSLPSTIIYYISKNPSTPTVYLKLVQSCKYFFEKLPILIAKEVYGNSRFCPKNENGCFNYHHKCCVDIDLKKLTSKIWLTHSIRVYYTHIIPNYFSLLSSKIYRSDVATLYIENKNILFSDFKLMASSAKAVFLVDAKIVDKNGNPVTLDAILQAVPNIEKIHCYPPIMGSSTLKNISKLPNLLNLCELYLYDVTENCKVDDYMEVIQKLKHSKIRFYFFDNVSEGFKNQLNGLIDIVIKDETIKCIIQYNGQDAEKFKIMTKRFY